MNGTIRHEKLNKHDSPCVSSPDYNFADCVERHVVMKVGCQIPWSRITMKGMPLCDNSTTFNKYDKYMDEVSYMQKDDLFRTTKCFIPCTFMEYKVSFIHIHQLYYNV